MTKTFEWDHGSYATGSIAITGIPTDGTVLTIGDGTTTKTFEFDVGDKASGTITLSDNPADGNTITIDDGTNAATVFEFDTGDGVEVGNVSVLIGETKEDTMAALIDAINGVVGGLLVTATANDPADNSCTLENDVIGTDGNADITKVGDNITVSGMAGGLEPYADVIAQTPIKTNDDTSFATVATRFDDLSDRVTDLE